jgi:hypothetical protein
VPGRGTALADQARSLRHLGPRPLLVARRLAERRQERRRRRRLRHDYDRLVCRPAAPAPLRPPHVAIPPLAELPAPLRPAAEALIAEALRVLAHEVDYLGSGPVQLGAEIDWHRDFKSGYRWPRTFYQDLDVTRLDDDSDAKVPWELSRGHQLLTLARAACLTGERRFARELESQLESWLNANPPGHGINWVTPMELAIRAINWAWAIGTLERVRPLSAPLRERVSASLQVHGRHIELNLEGSVLLRGNHYLADVVGLFALALWLPEDPLASRWERFARRALEREIHAQVLDDGVGFEASLPYHGLALELFSVAWLVGAWAGRALSDRYRRRLAAMLEVSRAVRHPDGRVPLFGDQDSGRVLPAGFTRAPTQDNLLDLGSAILALPRLREGPPHEEVAWTLGVSEWLKLARRAVERRPPPSAFPSGGLYVLRGRGVHMVARWGDVGQRGNGGHAHNDLSSYELSYGVPVVVDAGTYLYTADPVARDQFRSARAHNVLVVDGLDMHPLPVDQPFRMPAHARFRVEEWRESPERVLLTGSHDGFRRPGAPARCRRQIVLDRGAATIVVADRVEGMGRHLIESLVHLEPRCRAEPAGPCRVLVEHPAGRLHFNFQEAQAVELEHGWVSSQYGVREPAQVIRAWSRTTLPAGISYRIAPA